MISSSLTLIDSITGIDPSHQMAFVQQALGACSDALREIAAQSTQLVATANLHGPEISTILNLALEHGALNERALAVAQALFGSGSDSDQFDTIRATEGAAS